MSMSQNNENLSKIVLKVKQYFESEFSLKGITHGGSISILILPFCTSHDMTHAAWGFQGTCVMYHRPVDG